MKMIKSLIIVSFALFLMTGIAAADDLEDLDVTIRMMDSDDANEVEHELSLPDSASDSAREHAEDDGHENEGEHHSNDDAHDDNDSHSEEEEDREDHEEDREDHEEDHDEGVEDHDEGPEDTEDSSSPTT